MLLQAAAGFETGWSVELCVRDLLDQMDERIRLLCNPSPRVLAGSEDPSAGQVPSPAGDKPGEGGPVCRRPDVALAAACLGLTTPGIALDYPDDAEEHFLVRQLPHLFASLIFVSSVSVGRSCRARWPPGPRRGPSTARILPRAGLVPGSRTLGRHLYLGRAWPTHSAPSFPSSCLGPTYGSLKCKYCALIFQGCLFISSFFSMHALPHDLVPTLLRLLRPNVAYVTLVQHDAGMGMSCDSTLAALPNLLVLSAGASRSRCASG